MKQTKTVIIESNSTFAKELEEVASIESAPKLEGRTMTMILAPKK